MWRWRPALASVTALLDGLNGALQRRIGRSQLVCDAAEVGLDLLIHADLGLLLENRGDRRRIVGRRLDAVAGTDFGLRLVDLLLGAVQIGEVGLGRSVDIQYHRLSLRYSRLNQIQECNWPDCSIAVSTWAAAWYARWNWSTFAGLVRPVRRPKTWLTRVVAWATTCFWLCWLSVAVWFSRADSAGDLRRRTA